MLSMLKHHLFGKELFIRFSAHVFRVRLSDGRCTSFPFSFQGGMWDLIVLILIIALLFTFLFSIGEPLCTKPLRRDVFLCPLDKSYEDK